VLLGYLGLVKHSTNERALLCAGAEGCPYGMKGLKVWLVRVRSHQERKEDHGRRQGIWMSLERSACSEYLHSLTTEPVSPDRQGVLQVPREKVISWYEFILAGILGLLGSEPI
jgi:hypothetical protein